MIVIRQLGLTMESEGGDGPKVSREISRKIYLGGRGSIPRACVENVPHGRAGSKGGRASSFESRSSEEGEH